MNKPTDKHTAMCNCCAGTGKPISGLPCICGGVGTQVAELQGFRELTHQLKDQRDRLLEALKVARQALMEVRHAQNSGPEWYTHGDKGLFKQVRMWLDKAEKAMQEIKEIEGSE